MYEDTCYAKPFLAEVIVRIDLASPIAAINEALPPRIASAALSHFPISEPKKALEQVLQFRGADVQHTKTEITQWRYYGRNREKQLVIMAQAMFAAYSHYTTYEDLKTDFLSVLGILFDTYKDTPISRVGLRYINKLDIVSADPFSWSPYVNSNLLGLLNFFQDRQHLTRVFHIVELRFDDLNIKYQFGLPNPDFPAIIKKPLFVLDLDGYIQGPQEYSELASNLDRAHNRIQELFENSITNDLRSKMNA